MIICLLLLAAGAAFYWHQHTTALPPGPLLTDQPPVTEQPPAADPPVSPSLPTEGEKAVPPAPVSEIPVLMYHVIGDNQGSLRELFVSPEVFARQMQYLHENGYHTVTMAELLANWQTGTPLPPRPIIITFDDGYRSDYEQAFPAMQAYGFRGVHYLYVNKFEHPNSLTREEVAEMLAAGHEVGTHTYSHIDLTTVFGDRLLRETADAKAALEEMLDCEIISFAYPAGRYNETAIKAVEASGHALAVTTEYGYSRPEQGRLTLKRVRINRSDGLQGFINKLKQYEELQPLE